jgi:arsenate reductase-like glutaredoxin family protein
LRDDKLGLELEEINLAKGVTEEQVRSIVAAAGSVAAVMNTRHATAKAKGWAEKPPPVAEFATAVVAEVNLLRRPIVIHGATVIVGLNKTAYGKLSK